MELNYLFLLFHLNLAFSSVEEKARAKVIKQCYWPLLELAESTQLPIGIEVTGYTLEQINTIDPAWVGKFKQLLDNNNIELIGSGYSQLIGPLVPDIVFKKNLLLANRYYQNYLERVPKVILVNEQCYSSNLIEGMLDAGYETLIMEWDNPSMANPLWKKEWRFFPQYAVDGSGRRMALIWSQSIAFQKLQRYVHGELDTQEYLDYLEHLLSTTHGSAFCLYANDAEIFGYRPGRFGTEPDLINGEVEWQRLFDILLVLKQMPKYRFIPVASVFDLLDRNEAGTDLSLETIAHPVPVKKQKKYNVSRWAVTGRNDLWINTACHYLLNHFDRTADNTEELWQELCEFWASDYRTHITQERWHNMTARIASKLEGVDFLKTCSSHGAENEVNESQLRDKGFTVEKQMNGKYLRVRNENIDITFNVRRGLTVHRLMFKSYDYLPLLGTLQHGFFESIELGADFYSCGVIVELPSEQERVTDLIPVQYRLFINKDGNLYIHTLINTKYGYINKGYVISQNEECLQISYDFPEWRVKNAVVRVGMSTFFPTFLAGGEITVNCGDGKKISQSFKVNEEFDHGAASSTLVSCSTGLATAQGYLELRNQKYGVTYRWDVAKCAAFPLLMYKKSNPADLCRLSFSLSETDETARYEKQLLPFTYNIQPSRL